MRSISNTGSCVPISSTPLLDIRGLARRHPNGKEWLLDDVFFAIQPGQRVAIVGPSGAGKTLLLRSLALLDTIDGGEILWKGQAVAATMVPHFRRQVIYLHQRPGLFDGTVEENLRMPFHLKSHAGSRFDREWIIDCLQRLGRGAEFLAQSAQALSGGESQLVAVLRGIQLAPQMLLFDEPTASLDSDTGNAVERLAAEWLDAGPSRAMVWVSHNREQAHRMADRIFHMAGGRLTAAETSDTPASPPLA